MRRLVPVPIRALRWRYKWLAQTAVFARQPAGSTMKLLRWTAAELMKREISFSTPDGTPFVSMANNFSALAMYVANDRDPEIQDFIRGRLKPGAIFVDVGANIGAYTIRAGQVVGDTGRVIALEAHPRTFGFLERNIVSNGLRNIEALQLAASETPGVVELAYSDSNPGETHVSASAKPGTAQVVSQPLDSILSARSIARVDYIKIDVEGFELQVLKGACETIKNNPDIVVQVELDTHHAGRYGNSTAEVAQLLYDLGFMPYRVVKGGKLRPLQGVVREGNFDILWLHASSRSHASFIVPVHQPKA